MALLSKAAIVSAIAAASQVSFKSVYVPALGGDVNVKIQNRRRARSNGRCKFW